jgi:GT2 family glycosyltransferase
MAAVRVVIPTYNRARLIPDALRGAMRQTFSDMEIIVMDDGSTDETARVVQTFAATDARIRYARQSNAGAAAARNAAVTQPGTFDYVAFLDADDIWVTRTHIDLAVKALVQNPEVGLPFARVDTTDYTGRHWTADSLWASQERLAWPATHGTRLAPDGPILLPRAKCFPAMLRGDVPSVTHRGSTPACPSLKTSTSSPASRRTSTSHSMTLFIAKCDISATT